MNENIEMTQARAAETDEQRPTCRKMRRRTKRVHRLRCANDKTDVKMFSALRYPIAFWFELASNLASKLVRIFSSSFFHRRVVRATVRIRSGATCRRFNVGKKEQIVRTSAAREQHLYRNFQACLLTDRHKTETVRFGNRNS